MKTNQESRRIGRGMILTAAVLAGVILMALLIQNGGFGLAPAWGVEPIEAFAKEKGIPLSRWPEEMVELLKNNLETEEFVLNYPLEKGKNREYTLEEFVNCDAVPLMLQWDMRWGYHEYGGSPMGLSGCGPTCLSMVCMYLLKNPQLSPAYIADFGAQNGYYVDGVGSSWTLISEGGRKLGLDVVEIPLDENRIMRNLEVGNPVICSMGPGDFTTAGHFIVMVGVEGGKIRINDPNSKARSAQLWDYDQISGQIRNLWACRLPS